MNTSLKRERRLSVRFRPHDWDILVTPPPLPDTRWRNMPARH
jgi:hypothetical protein